MLSLLACTNQASVSVVVHIRISVFILRPPSIVDTALLVCFRRLRSLRSCVRIVRIWFRLVHTLHYLSSVWRKILPPP
jgi:hypothetical protein